MKSARYYEDLNGKSDARWKGRKERHDFAFRIVFAIWNTCVPQHARGAGDISEGCCAFKSRRLCWMCGGASINSYWFRCQLRMPPPPPPRFPFLLSSSVMERQSYRQLRIILIAFESRRETPDWMRVWAPTGYKGHVGILARGITSYHVKRNSHINAVACITNFMHVSCSLILWLFNILAQLSSRQNIED